MEIYAEKLLSPEGWLTHQVVHVQNGEVRSIRPGHSGALFAHVLAPGLIDIHTHGGSGFDLAGGSMQELEVFLTDSLREGVTSLLLTWVPHSLEVTRQRLGFIRDAMKLQAKGMLKGAHILGVHLEGPFVNPAMPGALLAEHIQLPGIPLFEEVFGEFSDMIRLITLAPEMLGALALIRHLQEKGIKTQAGHTNATYDEAMAAFDAGLDGLTHSFNACRPIHHREPGIVVASLLRKEVFCEVICDLEHLHAGTLKLVHALKGPMRTVAVSDAVMPTHLPNGTYDALGLKIHVKDGVNRADSGALCGGGVYLAAAVRNLASLQIDLADCLNMAAATPALRLGLTERGSIAPGHAADLLALDEDLRPVFTVQKGRLFHNSQGSAPLGQDEPSGLFS